MIAARPVPTVTLTPDRSDRPRFVRFVRYERWVDDGGHPFLVPVRVTRDANGVSLTEIPWSRIERQRGPHDPERNERWDVERLAAAAANVCTPTEEFPCRNWI